MVQRSESLFIDWLTDLCALTLDMEAVDPELPVVVMTAYGTLETAAEALRNKAF